MDSEHGTIYIFSHLNTYTENSPLIAASNISEVRRKCKERYGYIKDYVFDLESELREVENKLQEERRKRVTMKKNFGEAMKAMMEEMMGQMMEEMMREMMDHMTDEKIKDLWEAIKQLQIEGLPQNRIGESTDRLTESTRMKKRIRLEVEEFESRGR